MEFRDTDIQDFWEGTNLTPQESPLGCTQGTDAQAADSGCCLRIGRPEGPSRQSARGACGRQKRPIQHQGKPQWRLCFKWNNGEAKEVEFVDYHA